MTGSEPAGLPDSGLGPLGDIQLLATMLRSDRDDLSGYVRVLSGVLADALPAGMVEIDYERSLGDRLAGRPGRPSRVLIHGGEGDFELSDSGRGGVRGQVRRTVGGVVIARRDIAVEEWLRLLATELSARAASDARAREALGRLLGS